MAFLLARGTAAEWLRKNRNTTVFDQRYRLRYTSLEASRTRLERHTKILSPLAKPLQLAVWSRSDRRSSAHVQSHTFVTQSGWYPCVRIVPGVYCLAPEYVFLQMARMLDEERLLFLGMELCGRYGIVEDKVFLRDPTCCARMLLDVAQAERGVHGRARALTVAPRVMDGAASPMEIALALILSSECEVGGFGLPQPELNHALPVVGAARALWDGDTITPDLLWESIKLAIEYDSALHHTGASRVARDARRRDVLEELGYRVVTVTTEQINNYLELERIASIVATRFGANMEPESDAMLHTRLEYQQRMVHLATHPEELLCLPEAKAAKTRSWSVRKR